MTEEILTFDPDPTPEDQADLEDTTPDIDPATLPDDVKDGEVPDGE